VREPRGYNHFHRAVEEHVMDITSRFSANGNGCVVEETPKMESPGTAVPGLSGDRDAAGRFVPGNKGGPGNPYNRRVAQLKIWLAEVVGEVEIKAMGKKLTEMAIAGEIAAARVLFQYLLPKQVEPDRMNMEEWNLFKEGADMFAEMPALLTRPGPELPLEMVRATMETQTDRFRGLLLNLLRTPQDKMGEVSEMMVSDPTAAMEYLKTGSSAVLEKGKTRKSRAGRARNGAGKRGKR